MRFILTPLVGLALLATISLACDPASPVKIEPAGTTAQKNTVPGADSHSEPDDNAPRITLADAKKAFDEGNAYIIDVRGAEFYKTEHIKSAVNITSDTLDARYKEIPADKKIITYCS